MGPADPNDDRWRRFAHVLNPIPEYAFKTDDDDDNAGNKMDDPAFVCVDGTWIPEVELLRQGFEVVRMEASSEIKSAIDTGLKPDSDRQQGDHAPLDSADHLQ